MPSAIRDCTSFGEICSVIGPEHSRHSVNQSDSKLKPIPTGSPALSRASSSLLVFILNSDWLFRVFSFIMIGHCGHSIIGLRHSIEKRM